MELLSQVLISGITLGSLYALVGLGFVVIYRATKVVNFAQGEMMMLGAMLALYFYSDLQFPYFLAFILAVVLSGVFGAGLERFAYRPLLNAPVVTLILATVAVGQMIRAAVRILRGSEVSRFPSILSADPFLIGGVSVTPLSLSIIAIAILLVCVFMLFFRKTKAREGHGSDLGEPGGRAFGRDQCQSDILAGMGDQLRPGGSSWRVAGPIDHHHARDGIDRHQGLHRGDPRRLQLHSWCDRRMFSFGYHRKSRRGLYRKLDEGRHFLRRAGFGPNGEAARYFRRSGRKTSVRPSPRRHVMRGTIVLVFAACACAPLFLPNYPLFVLSLAIVNTIAVLGVNLVMGHAGQISLGQAGFSAIGAYATALLVVNLDVSYWLAVPAGALLAAISGYILGLPALRLGPLYVSMVTFGFGLIVVIIVQNWYELANGPNGMVVPPPVFFGRELFPREFHVAIVAVAAVLFLLARNIVELEARSCVHCHSRKRIGRSRHGREPGALQDDGFCDRCFCRGDFRGAVRRTCAIRKSRRVRFPCVHPLCHDGNLWAESIRWSAQRSAAQC